MNEESRILKALHMEWHLAWWCLDEHIRKRIRVPAFEIREMKSRWGMWQGDRKVIILSSSLIKNESWPCVREVLRHEMAHQLADEALQADGTSHGDEFRKACRMLNADPRASGDLPSIYQWIRQNDRPADPMVDKVRKLLALAASPNPHEAEAAMLKAHEWMIKFNVDPARTGQSEYVSMCLGLPALRHSAADDALAAILREFYFVETVYVSITIPAVTKKGKILEISGKAENVKMSSFIFDFLQRSMKDQAGKAGILGRKTRKDYALGFLKGVKEKLEGQTLQMDNSNPGIMALVKSGDVALHAYFRQRYPRLRTRYHGSRNMDKNAYNTGIMDGRKLVIHKPVESGPTARKRLLIR